MADQAKAVGERAQAQGGFSPSNMNPYDHIPKQFNDSDFYDDPNKIPPEVLKKAETYLDKIPQGVHDLDNQVGGLDVLGGGEAKAKFNALRKKQYDMLQHEGFHPLDYHRAKGVVEDHALNKRLQAVLQKRAQAQVQGNTAGDEYIERQKANFDNEVAQSAKERGVNSPGHMTYSNGTLARYLDDSVRSEGKMKLLDHVRDNHPDLYDHLRRPDNRKYWSNNKIPLEMHLEDNPVKSAQASPSASPAAPAQAKPQRKSPESIDGSQYYGPDGALDTKLLDEHIKKAGGTWDTDSAINRAYRPFRAALKAAPDVKTAYGLIDHLQAKHTSVYSHARQDAKYGNLPHHILIGNHYQLRNGMPLKRTNGQTVGNLPSKAYQESFRPNQKQTISRLVDWLTQE